MKEKSLNWKVLNCLNGKDEAQNIENEMFAISLIIQSCRCRKWDIFGVPCEHTISTIIAENSNHVEYLSK